jgi:hypothetical protein
VGGRGASIQIGSRSDPTIIEQEIDMSKQTHAEKVVGIFVVLLLLPLVPRRHDWLGGGGVEVWSPNVEERQDGGK